MTGHELHSCTDCLQRGVLSCDHYSMTSIVMHNSVQCHLQPEACQPQSSLILHNPALWSGTIASDQRRTC